jgi:hypothetical protein
MEIIKNILLKFFDEKSIKENSTHYILPSFIKPNKYKLYIDKKNGLAIDFISGKGYNLETLVNELQNFNNIYEPKESDKNNIIKCIFLEDGELVKYDDVEEIKNYLLKRLSEEDVINNKIQGFVGFKNSVLVFGVYIPINEFLYQIRIVNNIDKISSKYYNTKGINIKNYIFYSNGYDKQDFLFITEGSFDAISCNGISVFNNSISKDQLKEILKIEKDIILCLDNDEASKSGFSKSVVDLYKIYKSGKRKVFYFIPDECKDVNDLYVKLNKNKKLLIDKIVNSKKELNLYNIVNDLKLDKNNFIKIVS